MRCVAQGAMGAVLLLPFLAVAQMRPAAKPIAVMLLDGESGGPYHAWKLTTPVLKRELEETGLFEVTVVTAPGPGGDLSAFSPEFDRYRVVVLNYDAPDWPAELREHFENYVREGGGLVVVHAADNAFPGWAAYNRMIGVGGWRGRREQAGPHWFWESGKLVSESTAGPAGRHGARLPFQVKARAPEHPILKGLPLVWMHGADELYGNLRGPGENLTVLATAHSDLKNEGSGRDEPMLMTLRFGKGRIFHTTLGHDIAAMSCVGFIATLQRGTEWAATGKVTQKPPAEFPTSRTVSLRVDIEAMDPGFLGAASNPVMEGAEP